MRWLGLKDGLRSSPHLLWWFLLTPGRSGVLRRHVLRLKVGSAGTIWKWLWAELRRAAVWPLVVWHEQRVCRSELAFRLSKPPVNWPELVLVCLFAGILPREYLMLELYRKRSSRNLHRFVFPQEFKTISLAYRDEKEAALLADKAAFHALLSEASIPTVPILARFVDGTWTRRAALENYGSLFAKPTRGHGGQGSIRIERRSSDGYQVVGCGSAELAHPALYLGSRREIDYAALLNYLERATGSADVIIQPNLFNVESLQSIAPSGLSIVRIVTVRATEEPLVICASFCMPCNRQIISQRGCFAQIDLGSGRLSSAADFSVSGERRTHHPDSGQLIEGVGIPRWSEVVDLALRAHGLFPKTAFIGWDIAPTPQGPLVLEGNLNFCVQMLQKWPARPLLDTRMFPLLRQLATT